MENVILLWNVAARQRLRACAGLQNLLDRGILRRQEVLEEGGRARNIREDRCRVSAALRQIRKEPEHPPATQRESHPIRSGPDNHRKTRRRSARCLKRALDDTGYEEPALAAIRADLDWSVLCVGQS